MEVTIDGINEGFSYGDGPVAVNYTPQAKNKAAKFLLPDFSSNHVLYSPSAFSRRTESTESSK